jgi:hypothetical protein
VQLTLTQAPEGLEFAETSRNVTVPARRSVEVVFEPARRPSLLSGGRGFRLIAQSAEGRTEVSQELWLAQSERFPAAPTLNGQLDEWTGHTAIALDQETQFEVGPNGWKGPDDLSAKVMTGWDADHLYVAFQINDAGDWVVSRSGGSGLYSYDAVELFLDLDVMGDLAVTDLGEDDRQLMIGPGSGTARGRSSTSGESRACVEAGIRRSRVTTWRWPCRGATSSPTARSARPAP